MMFSDLASNLERVADHATNVAFVLFHAIKNKKVHVSRDKEIYLPDGDVVKYGCKNVGTILFIAIAFILTIANMLPN